MKKITTICFALAFIVSLAGCGLSADKASEKPEGHFVDVRRWDGAVVGTRYEEASEEIAVTARKADGEIVVECTMLRPGEFPYREILLYGLETYRIVDAQNKVIQTGTSTGLTAAADGRLSLPIPMDDLKAGAYKLIISEFSASSSAEDPLTNPLIISGEWECAFTW